METLGLVDQVKGTADGGFGDVPTKLGMLVCSMLGRGVYSRHPETEIFFPGVADVLVPIPRFEGAPDRFVIGVGLRVLIARTATLVLPVIWR